MARVSWPVFFGKPLALTLGLDPGAVRCPAVVCGQATRGDQKMQRTRALAIGDGNIQTLVTATECAEVGHGPIQPCKLQKARDQSGRLPEWQAEQSLQSLARLDRRVSEGGRTASLTTRFSQPDCRRIEPDQQRTILLEGGVVAAPVGGAVGRRCGFAYPRRLTPRSRTGNPADLCNRACYGTRNIYLVRVTIYVQLFATVSHSFCMFSHT